FLDLSMSEGVSNGMSLKGMSMKASSGFSEGGSGRVHTTNGLVVPAPKFKQCKVSVVWDFLRRCSRVATPVTRPSEQAMSD
ncbi:hypothetical protein J1N35_034338, partial [Gossypium stocksii]